MKMTIVQSAAMAGVAFAAGIAISATIGSSVSNGNALESVVAAPKNHRVLFENDHVRLLEVTVQPGETENLHFHQYPAVFAFDAPQPAIHGRYADGKVSDAGRNFAPVAGAKMSEQEAAFMAEIRKQLETAIPNGVPAAAAVGASPAHQTTVTDSFPAHFYRLEFKRIDGSEIMRKTSYP